MNPTATSVAEHLGSTPGNATPTKAWIIHDTDEVTTDPERARQAEAAGLVVSDVRDVELAEALRLAHVNKQLAESLLHRLGCSAAREGILRDTISLNHEWHQENGTYPQEGCDDLTGLLDVNLKAIALPDDDTALAIVIQRVMKS